MLGEKLFISRILRTYQVFKKIRKKQNKSQRFGFEKNTQITSNQVKSNGIQLMRLNLLVLIEKELI